MRCSGSVLGREEGDSVIRGGFTLGYNRPGMSDFTGALDDNPGVSQTATRNHALGNLGTPGSILLRNSRDLGPPPGLPTHPDLPDERRRHRRHHDLRREPAGSVRA